MFLIILLAIILLSIISFTTIKYFKKEGNQINSKYLPLVLWYIDKNNVYLDSTSYPNWFHQKYNINFIKAIKYYFKNDYLTTDDKGRIILNNNGERLYKAKSYLVVLHEHPEYKLSEDDFLNDPYFGHCSNNDIVWGILMKRKLLYPHDYKKQEQIHYCMLNILIEEKHFNDALDILFIVSYLETSGCLDNDFLYYMESGYDNNNIPVREEMFKIDNVKVTRNFYIIQEHLKLNTEEIRDRYINCEALEGLQSMPLLQYFDIQQSYELFMQAIRNKSFSGYYIPNTKSVSKIKYTNYHNITENIIELERQFMQSYPKQDLSSIKEICDDLIKIEPITQHHIKILHDDITYIVNRIYPFRNNSLEYENLCIQLCEKDVKYYDKLSKLEVMKNYKTTNLTKLCIIFENKNMINEAINLCDIGIRYNFLDTNNKTYELRKNRLLKKLLK